MNCRKGNLAHITAGPNRDKLVVILAADVKPGYWIVKSLAGPCAGHYRKSLRPGIATIGAAADACLRPLRGNPEPESIIESAPVPGRVDA